MGYSGTAMPNAITRVEIKDFLVFRGGFTADFCPGVNVIIGGNGSGKTTLLKVMYWACKNTVFQGEERKSYDKHSPKNYLELYDYLAPGSPSGPLNGDIKITFSLGDVSCSYESSNVIKDFKNSVEASVNSLFLPASEILSHSNGLLSLAQKYIMPFDQTEFDALINAELPEARSLPEPQARMLQKLSNVIDGDVVYSNGSFYVQKTDGPAILFPFEASGFRKFGLLWKLLRNGLLESGSIFFWDEPEASINPELIPTLVDILLELSRNGVQIFIATHSYDAARWFELNMTAESSLRYFNLRKTDSGIAADVSDDYVSLPNSVIDEADSKMLKRVAEVAAEKAGVRLK
jgi:energy-coupling factor transporter ATP-binding protein EcfA2